MPAGARQVVERAFGLLKNMWGLLRRKFKVTFDHHIEIIAACVLLYNFVFIRERYLCERLYTQCEVEKQRSHQRDTFHSEQAQELRVLDDFEENDETTDGSK